MYSSNRSGLCQNTKHSGLCCLVTQLELLLCCGNTYTDIMPTGNNKLICFDDYIITRSTHPYDASRCSKRHALMGGCGASVRHCLFILGVQRAAQNNNGNVKSEPKYLACEESPVRAFYCWTLSCSLGFYSGLTSLFYSLSESLVVGCVQHSLLHLTLPNTYVAKAKPRCPSRPPSPKKMSSQRHVMHMVSDILPGHDLKLTFLSATQIYIPNHDRHVHTYIHCENRSLIQSLALMRLAITIVPSYTGKYHWVFLPSVLLRVHSRCSTRDL